MGKILFDKCSCILIKPRDAAEFTSVGAAAFYHSGTREESGGGGES